MEQGDSLDAPAHDVEPEIFVRRMDGVAFKAKAHKHRFDTQLALKVADDGDASAATHSQWRPPESIGKGPLGSPVSRERKRTDIALATMHGRDLNGDAAGRNGANVISKKPGNLFVILVRDKAARHLGLSPRRQNSLGPFASIAAPNPANVERRTAAVALQRRIPLLAFEFTDANCSLVGLLVKRYVGYHGALFARDVLHVVVKPGTAMRPSAATTPASIRHSTFSGLATAPPKWPE